MEEQKRNLFIDCQNKYWNNVLTELKNGEKETHWMWFVFPQIEGLSESQIGQTFAIKDLTEAKEYFNDEILGVRLMELLNILLELETDKLEDILNDPDDLKFVSCMTLFKYATNDDIFVGIQEKFGFEDDELTLEIIKEDI